VGGDEGVVALTDPPQQHTPRAPPVETEANCCEGTGVMVSLAG